MSEWKFPGIAKFDEKTGELRALGWRYAVLGAALIPQLHKEFQDIQGDVSGTIIYNAAKKHGKIFVKQALEHTLSGKIVHKMGISNMKAFHIKLIENGLFQCGFGRSKIMEYDINKGKFVMRLYNSFEAYGWLELYKKSRHPVCHAIRGFLAGAASFMCNYDIDCKETKCLAKGDKYCEFMLFSSDANRTTS
jgi:predicted hydrocarbon binding protein